MGKSNTVTVTVQLRATALSILVYPSGGPPGETSVTGVLTSGGSPVEGKDITLLINGVESGISPYGPTMGDGSYGFYRIPVEAGTYKFQTKFAGDYEYSASSSTIKTVTFAKVASSISITVSPASGAPPLDVVVSGKLKRNDTGAGIGAATVILFREGAQVGSASTSYDPATLGQFSFADTISTPGSFPYYVFYEGDDRFEGCEKSDGTVVTDGVPSDMGPLLLLALVVMTQE